MRSTIIMHSAITLAGIGDTTWHLPACAGV
jgi:hypothetical protein